jgi:hypothetical protein
MITTIILKDVLHRLKQGCGKVKVKKTVPSVNKIKDKHVKVFLQTEMINGSPGITFTVQSMLIKLQYTVFFSTAIENRRSSGSYRSIQ